MNLEKINRDMRGTWAGKTVHFAAETTSTNDWLKTLAKEGAKEGTLCLADHQSAGKGRLGRTWSEPAGTAVTMSLLLRPAFSPEKAAMLTLVMGLAVSQALEGMGFFTTIKWPNDVVLDKKKVCGILTEMSVREDGRIDYVIIGVGINVNVPSFPQELEDKATSLFLQTGSPCSREEVICRVMKAFEDDYEAFCQAEDMSSLKKAYEKRLANLGQPVRVLDHEQPYEGICEGITPLGELCVKKEDGTLSLVRSGEVSVRGLYSYV